MRRLALVLFLVFAFLVPLPADAATGPISRNSAGQLILNGSVYRFTGVNAYELATWWASNPGCGGQVNNLAALFGRLRPNSLVRFWATQQVGTNTATGRTDWTALDRVFAAAEKYHQRLIPTLADQWGACDVGHWKDTAWYNGDYTKRFNDDGSGYEPLSYAAWVNKVVPRYANSPALGMWELVNEPEGTNCARPYWGNQCWGHTSCNEAAAARALRHFFDTEAVHVKALDPKHLVAAGFIGSGQCGLSGDNYKYVGASRGLDVLTYHDYGRDVTAVPDAIPERVAQAKALRKPIFTEEVGIRAVTSGGGCVSLSRRTELLQRKLASQVRAGMSGFLPWNWTPTAYPGCSLDIGAYDPAVEMLRTVRLAS